MDRTQSNSRRLSEVSRRLSKTLSAMILPVMALGLTPSALAASDGIEAVGLSYDVDAAVTYLDVLQHPPAQILVSSPTAGSKEVNTGENVSPTVGQPRTIGLRRMKLGLLWQAPHSTSLHVVLRPDAVNQQFENGGLSSPPREFDDRSGDPGMKPMPTIRLLDAYQLAVNAGPALNLAVGVWEGFGETERAYPELLGFGLTVMFPAKFSAIRVSWQLPNTGLDTAASPGVLSSNFAVSSYLFEGDEDRAEARAEKHGAYDTAPTAHDPYHGGAVELNWRLRPELTLGLIGGYLQQADSVGEYDEAFAQARGDSRFHVLSRQAEVGLDTRFEISHGHGGVADQTLFSAMLTGRLALEEQLWAVMGVGDGRGTRWTSYTSQRQTTVDLDGYQIEGGMLDMLSRDLSLQLMLSHEHRTMKGGGVKTGGFLDSSGSQSTIHRVGLELTYRLNQNV